MNDEKRNILNWILNLLIWSFVFPLYIFQGLNSRLQISFLVYSVVHYRIIIYCLLGGSWLFLEVQGLTPDLLGKTSVAYPFLSLFKEVQTYQRQKKKEKKEPVHLILNLASPSPAALLDIDCMFKCILFSIYFLFINQIQHNQLYFLYFCKDAHTITKSGTKKVSPWLSKMFLRDVHNICNVFLSLLLYT